ncbi:MAG TPA: ATP-binding protein [Gaiellaceae bacterium]|nr:ATP-binding protein [Gaiellaceae bacterium]
MLARLGLRTRMAAALVATAVLAVGIATVFSNAGLPSRVNEAAEARLERQAWHLAAVAATFYREDGRWTPEHVEAVTHLGEADGLLVELTQSATSVAPGGAVVPVVVDGQSVGRLAVEPVAGLLTPEEQHLRSSLDRLHIAAAGASVVAALVLALLLAEGLSRPLRRIRRAAERIAEGEVEARVRAGGGPEVGAVASALNRLAETLEREEALRRQTVADVAHELRTPVHGLLSRIEAAEDGVLGPEANLAGMHAEALRLARLLDDLSRLAEAERPGLLLQKAPVDVGAVAAAAADAFAARFAEASIRLERSPEPADVHGDRDRLEQIAANLLSNALRYTEPDGRVRVVVRRDGDRVLLEVEDTGIGIAPADLPHVFKRFWRGEGSRSRVTGGAGVGLAIVHELVRAHDGHIDVESRPGEGSRFRVSFPAARAVHENGGRTSQDLQSAERR